MDFNVEVRKKQLESLDSLITACRHRVLNTLKFIGWTSDLVKKEAESMCKCPFTSSHKVPTRTIDKHLGKCCLKSAGYSITDDFLSESCGSSQQTIYLDNAKKIAILSNAYTDVPNFRQAWNGLDPDPKTSDRYMSTFSPDERRVLYDYCIQNTKGPPVPPEFITVSSERDEVGKEKVMTYAEQCALERDLKRRSAKYRSGVHTNRKNHTEVIREVISNQMEDYKHWLISGTEYERTRIQPNNLDIKCNDKVTELESTLNHIPAAAIRNNIVTTNGFSKHMASAATDVGSKEVLDRLRSYSDDRKRRSSRSYSRSRRKIRANGRRHESSGRTDDVKHTTSKVHSSSHKRSHRRRSSSSRHHSHDRHSDWKHHRSRPHSSRTERSRSRRRSPQRSKRR